MSFAVSGFAAIAQDYISKGVASNFYEKAPLLAVMAALTIGREKKALAIGRPGNGEILTGKGLSPAEKMSLSGINSYRPRIQGFKTSNTRARTNSGRVTASTVADSQTRSHGQATQYSAEFKWTHYDTPIKIWHEDKNRASQKGSGEGRALEMSRLIDEATEVAMQDMHDKLADDVRNGDPSDQSDDLWNEPAGIIAAADSTNTYGGVDRSDSDAVVWRANKVTAARGADFRKLKDEVNLTLGLETKGNGVNLALCGTGLYQIFRDQVLARGGGRCLGEGLPEFATMGLKREVVQVDNLYLMYDPGCPVSTVEWYNLRYWKYIQHPEFNMKVTPFENQAKQEGGEYCDYAEVQHRFILSCDDPANGVARHTAVG